MSLPVPPKPQLNLRISDDRRKLLKLLAFLLDKPEGQLVEDALMDLALHLVCESNNGFSVTDSWEDREHKIDLLIKAVERIKGIKVRHSKVYDEYVYEMDSTATLDEQPSLWTLYSSNDTSLPLADDGEDTITATSKADRPVVHGLHGLTGRVLKKLWDIPADHVLYREDGEFYMPLTRFPGAYCDAHGYIVFNAQEEYKTCPYLQIGKRVNVPKPGISAIPGYVRKMPV